jgi:hypothetical protein
MTPDEQPSQSPAGPESEEEVRREQEAADARAHDRVWSDPLPTGDLVTLDPAEFKPPLTPEQLKELLEENKE